MDKKFLSVLRKNELGIVALALGLLTLAHSGAYEIGTLEHMGPGYYPMLLGAALCILGALKLVAGVRNAHGLPHTTTAPAVRPGQIRFWAALLGGMLAFITLGAYAGFLPATLASILITTLGTADMTIKDRLSYSVIATVLIIGVFRYSLNIQFPLFVGA